MGVPSQVLALREGERGPLDQICDVPGLRVSHVTVDSGDVHTGVTVVLPHPGGCFEDKVMAAAHVANGFGKTVGLVQVAELGTLESPIVLTNTLSVGTAQTALVRHLLAQNLQVGRADPTVNPVVCECNDGHLSDIRALAVTEEDVERALLSAEAAGEAERFEEGSVGAGRGMCCLGLKGGIGSASRVLDLGGERYVLGCLVLANFGRTGDLVLDGRHVGVPAPASPGQPTPERDQGSCIMIVATSVPLVPTQLARVARRAELGLARTGSRMGTGSGDIALAFSTANRVPQHASSAVLETRMLADAYIDQVFRATVDVVEESVVSALWHAEAILGRDGHRPPTLRELLPMR